MPQENPMSHLGTIPISKFLKGPTLIGSIISKYDELCFTNNEKLINPIRRKLTVSAVLWTPSMLVIIKEFYVQSAHIFFPCCLAVTYIHNDCYSKVRANKGTNR